MDAHPRHGYHGARVAPVAQLDRVLPSEGNTHELRGVSANGQIDRRNTYAPVAQLDRVPPSEGGGRGFESRLVRHILLIYEDFFKNPKNRAALIPATSLNLYSPTLSTT